jgi:hypothetical protein
MRALVVYESMFGNTHAIADAIGRGLAQGGAEVEVVPVDGATPDRIAHTDLLVVGGPTHVFGLATEHSRHNAVEDADRGGFALDDSVTGETPRHWLHHFPSVMVGRAAAFDTRLHRAATFTGSAARGIARRLHHHGLTMTGEPTSFYVEGTEGGLEDGEEVRAEQWGADLARIMANLT